jgi:hypothetical protein
MRTKRERLIVGVVLATAMVAGTAAAEPEAPAPAAAESEASPPVAAPAPAAAPARPVAARPVAGVSAPRVKEGFQVIPAIGINSFQGDTGNGTGVGLRVGLLAGSRLAEIFSLNLGLAFDKVNMKTSDASGIAFEVGVSPLFHFPQEKFEILVGPALGSYVDHATFGSGPLSADGWRYGWTLGANAGVMIPVGSKVSVGGLLNFMLRNPLKSCVTTNGNDVCQTDGLVSEKVLALTAAAMF